MKYLNPKLPLSLGLLSTALIASETSIQMKDLPAPVKQTVKEQTKNAQLRGLSKEIQNGQTVYEAETKVNGKSRDILIDPSGVVVQVEEATTFRSLPPAVQQSLQKLAGSRKIARVETVTRGSVVSYAAVVKQNGAIKEIAVNSDGSAKQ